MSNSLKPLRLPAAPAEPPPTGFPLIASVAPLVAAAAIWFLTGSVFALVFAALSPVMAVASLLDGRRMRRRAQRRGSAEYDVALAELRTLAAERQVLIRNDLWEHTPSASSILAAHDRAAYWPSDGGTTVSLGSGSIDGGLRVDGADTTPEQRALSLEIATLNGAPIVVDATQGIGIVGALPVARALARALVIQLSTAQPPTRCRFTAPSSDWEWASVLPHAESTAADREVAVWEHDQPTGSPHERDPGDRLLIAVASSITSLPPRCDTIVRVHGPDRAEIVRSAAQQRGLLFRPELIATAEAARFAAVLRRQALSSGLLRTDRALPSTVAFAVLDQGPSVVDTSSLDCTIGQGEQGAITVDLVRHGPHAVVGGTTGSGKSELLVTWILAMAKARSAQQVNFLLVDFKGGAAFGPLATLPHCVGLVTDLDAGEAARALASLSAELRHRERILRDAHARDIDDPQVPPTPRLVIVIDEFATMLDAFPPLHALFVDVAARGRSLGVHLILCTQRPAGVVRDALLANCSLRISLRVNNRADSLALLGTDAAAELPATAPGRALIDTGENGARLCQIATADQRDLADLIAAHPPGPPPRRPWLEPLPTRLTREVMRRLAGDTPAVEADAESGSGSASFTLGLIDEPDEQRYGVAGYSPADDGHLLVLGAARSGKSAVLALIEAEAVAAGFAVESVGADVERAWDLLDTAHHQSGDAHSRHDEQGSHEGRDGAEQEKARPQLLLFDDFDSVLARWEPDHRLVALDLLAAVLRDGPAAGITCVVSTQLLAHGLQFLSTLCPSRLLLRSASRELYLAAGGLSELHDPALPPGGGTWCERRIQVLAPAGDDGRTSGPAPLPTSFPLESASAPVRTIIVVAGSPGLSADRFRRSSLVGADVVELNAADSRRGRVEIGQAPVGTVFVGDADAWQTEWALLNALRPQSIVVFDGCSLADFRLISRRRELPPPLAPAQGRLWVIDADGRVRRSSMAELMHSNALKLVTSAPSGGTD